MRTVDDNLNPKTTMNRFHSFNARLRAGFGFAVIAAALVAFANVSVIGADAKPNAGKATAAKKGKPAAKKLDGAALYAIHCNRCHAERYPTEFNSGQWKSLMMHMRVRASLPAAQARTILKYLQEESGNQ